MFKAGDRVETNRNGTLEVVAWKNAREVTVRFLETGYTTITTSSQIQKGTVKDRLRVSVYGAGSIGEQKASVEGRMPKAYMAWMNLLRRTSSTLPGYEECTMEESWKSLEVFSAWFEPRLEGVPDPALDKDILVKGNRHYGPATCCVVPQQVNNLFIKRQSVRGLYPIGVRKGRTPGTFLARYSDGGKRIELGTFRSPEQAFSSYKKAKEAHIRRLAEEYRHCLRPEVYSALLSYQVEPTD